MLCNHLFPVIRIYSRLTRKQYIKHSLLLSYHTRRYVSWENTSNEGNLTIIDRPHIDDLIKASKRPFIVRFFNPFSELPYVIPNEHAMYDRVHGLATTLTVVFALLCGISGSVLLQEPMKEKQIAGQTKSVILRSLWFLNNDEGLHEELLTWKYGFLSFSFLYNAGSLLTSTVFLVALNSTPAGQVCNFVRRNSLLISAMGFHIFPGTVSLSLALSATAELSLPYPAADVATGGCMIVIIYISVVSLSLLMQNFRMRQALIKKLFNLRKTKM